MNWRRAVKLAVAGVGLATALAVLLLTRARPAPTGRAPSGPVDPDATMQSGRGVDTRHRGDERIASFAHDGSVQYKDGRAGWRNARVTFKDGSVLSAGLVQSTGKAATGNSPGSELEMSEGVHLDDKSQGATLAGASGTYSDKTGTATIPGAVTFAKGRITGSGTGAVYARDAGTFRVLADVRIMLQAGPTGDRIEATAESMTFTSATRSMAFERRAQITRATEVLSADRAVLFLADKDEQFRAIELRGHSRVSPAQGASTGLPEMEADDIDLAFHDGTQALREAALNGRARMVQTGADLGQAGQTIEAPRIDLKTAPDGKTLTDLRAGPRDVTVRLGATKATPARTIESAALAATGSNAKGLQFALFTGGVTFTEQVPASGGRAAAKRTGTARTLNAVLAGKLDAVETATFQQDVTFRDGGMTGDADTGIYEATRGRLVLQPFSTRPGKLPRVTDGDGDVQIDASAQITVDLNTHDLEAEQNVKTLSRGKGKGAARGFFTPGEQVIGSSVSLQRDGTTKRLRYAGSAAAPASVQQGDNSRIEGLTIVVDEATGDLEATGQVKSRTLLQADAAPARRGGPSNAPRLYLITAETMAYVDKQRTATYQGAPVVLTRPDGVTRSKRLVVTLATGGERRLERLEAEGDVTIGLDGGRDAKADQLLYDATADRYTLRGGVAVRVPNKDGTCSVSIGQVAHITGAGANLAWPKDENRGGAKVSNPPCTAPLP